MAASSTNLDLRRIKAGIARAYDSMDQAISAVQSFIEQSPPAAATGPDHRDQDPRFRLEVVQGTDTEAAVIIELHEIAPRPKLVGFVELDAGATFELIDRLADRIGLDVYIAHKGKA